MRKTKGLYLKSGIVLLCGVLLCGILHNSSVVVFGKAVHNYLLQIP
jgi:hypothetical protein